MSTSPTMITKSVILENDVTQNRYSMGPMRLQLNQQNMIDLNNLLEQLKAFLDQKSMVFIYIPSK